MREQYKKEFRCSKCGLLSIYTLKDGTRVCRTCGHREKKLEVKK